MCDVEHKVRNLIGKTIKKGINKLSDSTNGEIGLNKRNKREEDAQFFTQMLMDEKGKVA